MTMSQMPEPPYYAVIFTSRHSDNVAGYAEMAQQMSERVAQQAGFLGVESARDAFGVGITVSYWSSLQAIEAWRQDLEHQQARALGKQQWYHYYHVKIAKVERAYSFTHPDFNV